MCYSLRELDRQRNGAMQEPLPPSTSKRPFSRPRIAGAIAAALAALVAAAALIWPSETPALSSVKPALPAAPVVIEQTSAGVDDGVPSGTDVARSGRAVGERHCAREL